MSDSQKSRNHSVGLSEETWQRLVELAKKNERSLTEEVEKLVKKAYIKRFGKPEEKQAKISAFKYVTVETSGDLTMYRTENGIPLGFVHYVKPNPEKPNQKVGWKAMKDSGRTSKSVGVFSTKEEAVNALIWNYIVK